MHRSFYHRIDALGFRFWGFAEINEALLSSKHGHAIKKHVENERGKNHDTPFFIWSEAADGFMEQFERRYSERENPQPQTAAPQNSGILRWLVDFGNAIANMFR